MRLLLAALVYGTCSSAADNKINDVWSCENPDTLGHLKKDLNFTGWVS
eukprot:COSAG06_NODE_23720_length_683_cov_1.219178_2_plen_48_part_00